MQRNVATYVDGHVWANPVVVRVGLGGIESCVWKGDFLCGPQIALFLWGGQGLYGV